MDYQTKPLSRLRIRRLAPIMRRMFGVPESGPFPVLQALEKLGDVFRFSNYLVVEDNLLPCRTMARCIPNNLGGFTIEIKQTVYDGAYQNGTGAFLGFICHEICHVFLFSLGFMPISLKEYEANTLPAFCSTEWQAKALCGEVMAPYGECAHMPQKEIVKVFHCSASTANYQKSLLLMASTPVSAPCVSYRQVDSLRG